MPRITVPPIPTRHNLDGRPCKISIIIPSFNDSGCIVRTVIGSWQAMVTFASTEIIVVDGGSTDSTVVSVRRLSESFRNGDPLGRRPITRNGKEESFFHSVHVMEGVSGGRARRMNQGARIATGDVLIFLQPDTLLPQAFDAAVLETLAHSPKTSPSLPTFIVGTFELAAESSDPTLLPLSLAFSYGSKFLHRPIHPAQPIFLTSDAFLFAGGFPDQPIFDTIEFVTRASRIGGIVRVVSGERVLIAAGGGKSLGFDDEGWRVAVNRERLKSTSGSIKGLGHSKKSLLKESSYPTGGDLFHSVGRWGDMGSLPSESTADSEFSMEGNEDNPIQTTHPFFIGGPGAKSAFNLGLGVLLYAYLGMTPEYIHGLLTGIPVPDPPTNSRRKVSRHTEQDQLKPAPAPAPAPRPPHANFQPIPNVKPTNPTIHGTHLATPPRRSQSSDPLSTLLLDHHPFFNANDQDFPAKPPHVLRRFSNASSSESDGDSDGGGSTSSDATYTTFQSNSDTSALSISGFSTASETGTMENSPCGVE
ncbi:hypothetical protein HDU67_006057, partial [Dinochytrium kinnereticum]